jgi:ABC-type antimicrobial peptide transport system permease subunit
MNGYENLTLRTQEIQAIQDVVAATPEIHFYAETSAGYINIRGINTSNWIDAAYYDPLSFSGRSISDALEEMETDNRTIVLDINTASLLDLELNDTLALIVGMDVVNLRVVGFFGPLMPPSPFGFGAGNFWSYISLDLWQEKNTTFGGDLRILADVDVGANTTVIIEEIEELGDEISFAVAAMDLYNSWQDNALISGVQNVTQVGLVFALISAVVGTTLLTFMTMKERQEELALMAVKGLSFGQLLKTLLVESLGVVLVASLIGGVVATIHNHSYVISQNSTIYASPVLYRFYLSPLAYLQTIGVFLAVIFGVVLPIIYTAYRAPKNFVALR